MKHAITADDIDDRLILELGRILAEKLGQSIETISDEQIQAYLEQLLAEPVPEESAPVPAHILFLEQAERTPGAVALVPDGAAPVSYAELRRQAEHLALQLVGLGCGPETLVAVFLDRPQDVVVSLLAVLLAGGAYVPLPPDDPAAYRARVLEQTQPAIVISERRLVGRLLPHTAGLLCLDDAEAVPAGQTLPEVTATSLACVIYTLDQGLQIEHRGLHNQIRGLQARFELTPADTLLLTAPFGLDAAVWQILWPLTQGARLVLPRGHLDGDPAELLRIAAAQRVNILHQTPPALDALLQMLGAAALPNLRWVLCSGGPLPRSLTERFFHHLSCGLCYLYGPPEAAAFVTAQGCTPAQSGGLTPIGHADTSMSLYVLDAHAQPLPAGAAGDIYIAGESLARGYLRDPAPTQERFRPDPFAPAAGRRMVRTGDQGRRLSDGTFELLPTNEQAVWVNGYRAPLRAIASRLMQERSIKHCVVLGRQNARQQTELVAYVVPAGPFLPARLHAYAQAQLPAALRPSAFVPLGSLPLTSAGRPDGRALSELPVIDRNLLQRWEQALREQGDLSEVAVVAQPHAETPPPYDLATLLADLPGVPASLPSWCYRTIWRRKELVEGGAVPRACTLIFDAGSGLAMQLHAELTAAGHTCSIVETGSRFERMAPHRYRAAPACHEDCRALFAALAANGALPDQIVYLWAYSAKHAPIQSAEQLDQAQERGILALLALAQALAQVHTTGTPVDLAVVTCDLQPVAASDPLDYTQAPLLGLIKTLPQELPWLHCRQIDLASLDSASHAGTLLRELTATSGDSEVAYRNRQRLVPRLQHVDLRRELAQPLPFKSGGFYLLSGGLGGIGVIIARYLLEHYQARLLLVGRTRLPSPGESSADPKAAHALQRYQSLAGLGGQVRYAAVDICDQEALRDALAQAQDVWQQQLDGIIQMAVEVEECLLTDQTPARLRAGLRAQVAGTWALHQLLEGDPQRLFLSFASINGLFGGALVGVYAAASLFLDHFAHAQRAQGLRSYCYTWTIWDKVGISNGYTMQDLSLAHGYAVMTPEQGLATLLAGLARGQQRLIIGLDGANQHIRRLVDSPDTAYQQIRAYIDTPLGADRVARLHELRIADRFGVSSRARLIKLEALPRDQSGAIALSRLDAAGSTLAPVAYAAPRNETEQTLASIWQEALGLERVGIHQRFFELGGDSVLAIQIVARAARAGVPLNAEQMFRLQTIAELAAAGAVSRPIHAEQGLVSGPVPLTPAQHFFFTHHMPVPDHFNHAYLYEPCEPLRPDLLEQALRQLVLHHDALRLRFFKTEQGWRQEVAAPEDHPLCTAIDLTKIAPDQRDAVFEAHATQLQQSLSLAHGPLLRVALVTYDAADPLCPQRLLMIIHHLVVDGFSWRILIEDLQTAYGQLVRGEAVALPPKTTSFKHWAERLAEYGGSPEPRQDLDYWVSQPWPSESGVPLDRAGANSEGSSDNVSLELSREATRALRHVAPAAYSVQITDLMLAAIARAFARWTGARRLLVEIAHHGRRPMFDDVDLSRTVGWFSTLYPVLLDLGAESDPYAQVRAVNAQMERVPSQGFNFQILQYLSGDEAIRAALQNLPRPAVLLTYLGQFDQPSGDSALLTLIGSSVGPIHDAQGTRMYELVFNQLIAGEQLGLGLTYSSELHERATVEHLAQTYMEELENLTRR